jgi:hypothetical protein
LAIRFNPRGPTNNHIKKDGLCRCLSGRACPDRFLEGVMDRVEQYARATSRRLSNGIAQDDSARAEHIKQGMSQAKLGRSRWRAF